MSGWGHPGLIFKTHGCCRYWAIKLSFLAATVKEIVSVNCRSYRQPLHCFFQRLPGKGYWFFEKSRQRKDSADDGENWRPNKECDCLYHGQRLSWHGLWEQRCSHMISPHNTSFILGRLRLQSRFIEDEMTSPSLSHIDSHHEIFDKKDKQMRSLRHKPGKNAKLHKACLLKTLSSKAPPLFITFPTHHSKAVSRARLLWRLSFL